MRADWLADGNHIAFFLAAWLVSYALHSTLLIGGAWALTRPARLSMGARDALWKVALAGAFLTATWQTVGIGASPIGGRLELPLSTVSADPLEDTELTQAREVQIGASRAQVVRTPSEEEAGSAEATEASRGSFLGSLREQLLGATGARVLQLLLGAWLLGAALGLSRVVVARVRLHRVLRGRRELEGGPARHALDRLCDEAGWSHAVRLTVSPKVAGPIALGRDEICLPERALRTFPPRQLESVLAHELAHLTRRDPSWRMASWIIERVFFFQPLLRLARRELQECAEFLCDDWAVARTGDGVSLARCLVEVAEWRQGIAPATSAPEMAAGDSPLGRRVERLLASRGGRDWPRVLQAMAAVLLLALVGAAAPIITVKAPQDDGGDTGRSNDAAYLAELVDMHQRHARDVRHVRHVRLAPPAPPEPPAPPIHPAPPNPPAPPILHEVLPLPEGLGSVLVFEVSSEDASTLEWKATLNLKSLPQAFPATRIKFGPVLEQMVEEQETITMEGMLQLKEQELRQLQRLLERTRVQIAKRREKI